jgi:nucleotide-binding universal stress UspA family protein
MIADAIGRRAKLCDVVMISDDLRANDHLFRQVAHGVLFQSPVGLVVNDRENAILSGPKQVFVAWNTSLTTARAVQQALPILKQAQNVIVGTVDPVMAELRDGEDPGVDVAKWLTHHGCNVTVQQFPSGGKKVGDCILECAKQTGTDLIVMGAYGHSRTREALFGGTTRTLIEQRDQPVFLAH